MIKTLSFRDPGFIGAVGSGGPSYGPTIDDWVARVIANGGADPSVGTKTAMQTFYDGLFTDGIDTKMIALCCFVPDSLIAAITPLIVGPGNDPWTNTNFVGGDLTVDGLVGNGTDKRLDTGCAPNATFASVDDTGMTVYCSYVNEVKCEMGSSDGTNHMRMNWQVFGTTFAYEHNGDATFGHGGSSMAYMSCNRPAGVGNQCYRASVAWGSHSLAATSGDAAGSLNNRSIYAFCTNNSGTPQLFCSKRVKAMALHEALSSTQSSNFYTRLKQLRTDLGDGGPL